MLLTWRDKTLIAILLLVARIVNDDPVVGSELKALANRISVTEAQ